MNTGTMCVIEMQKGNWEAETRGMGPNGARRVVWAPGVFFFCIIRVSDGAIGRLRQG